MRKSEQDILECIQDQNRRGNCCLLTSRQLPKSAALRLVASGHVVERECVVMGDDGFALEPERWRTGYELTELGRKWLSEMTPDASGYHSDRVWRED